MADILTVSERSLIDTAVSAGRVRVIASGTSGIDEAEARQWKGRSWFNGANVSKRRTKIRRLATEGRTVPQTDVALGLKTETVRSDLAARLGGDMRRKTR